jgi:hypothetical protein
MSQVVEHLPRKHKALTSKPSITRPPKKKRGKEKKKERKDIVKEQLIVENSEM